MDPLELWRETFQSGELAEDGAQLAFWLDGGENETVATLEEITEQAHLEANRD